MESKKTKQINISLTKNGALPDKTSIAQLESLLKKSSLKLYVVNCAKARSQSAIYRAIALALDYPVFFAKDTDALIECFKEALAENKQGMVLYFSKFYSDDDALQKSRKELEHVLESLTYSANKQKQVFAYYLEHVGKHPDPVKETEPLPYGGE